MQDAFISVSWAPILVLLRDLGQVTTLLGSVSSSVQKRLESPRFPSLDLGVKRAWWASPLSLPHNQQSVSVPSTLPAPSVLTLARRGKVALHIAPYGAGKGPEATGDPPVGGCGGWGAE